MNKKFRKERDNKPSFKKRGRKSRKDKRNSKKVIGFNQNNT
jgi:hypothetical protein